MAHKTIEISEEVYKKLTELKPKNESISNFILQLINEKKKNSNKEFDGTLKEDSEEWEKIEKILYEDRLKSKSYRDIEL